MAIGTGSKKRGKEEYQLFNACLEIPRCRFQSKTDRDTKSMPAPVGDGGITGRRPIRWQFRRDNQHLLIVTMLTRSSRMRQ